MLHTYLYMTFALLIQQLCAPSLSFLSLLSFFLFIIHSSIPPSPSYLYAACVAQSSSFPTHSAPSAPVFQGRLWAPVCKETEIAGALQNAAAVEAVCACLCVRMWATGSCLNAFPWSWGAPCASEASVLEDVCRVRADGMQMFLSGMAGKAA